MFTSNYMLTLTPINYIWYLFFLPIILVRNLLNLVPKEEWNNLEQHDQLENNVSVFAELLMETEKWEASS